jgi:beta-galactosidase
MSLLSNSPFKIGVNYWPASSAIKMWSEWDSNEVLQDFQQMSDSGLDLVRFFIFTPDFVKQGEISHQQLAHYKTVLEHLKTADLLALPTLFVGHMSGQNYRVDGWDDTRFFTDPKVLNEQKAFIKAILDISKDSEHIAGWCLSNEMPNDFPGKNSDEVTQWFTEIIGFVKESESRPVVIGDGVWSPEITGIGRENNLEPSTHYKLRELAPLQDILGVHFYPRYDDFWPQSYTSGFRILMAKSWKQEVFLEEFGHSITMGSEENQALYYREVIFSAMQAGASAALNWCWTDFEKSDLRPYLHNTFENRFGLRRSDGKFRPALAEMQKISRLSQDLQKENWELAPRDSYLIVPSNYYHPFPFDWDRDTDEKYELYLHTYGALASSGALPTCIHEPGVEHRSQDHDIHFTHHASFVSKQTTMWLPALKRLSAPFWEKILKNVDAGGVLYTSFANDLWICDLDETMGVDSNLRFGLPDYYPDVTLSISSPCLWGPFGESTISIQLGAIKNTRSLAYLPAVVKSAEVLLQDEAGRPLLVKKARGEGFIYFSLFPFEMLMTQSCNDDHRDLLTMIYAAIREDIVSVGSSCTKSAGEFMRFTRKQEIREYLFNHAWEPRAFDVRLRNKERTIKNFRVELPPKSFCQVVDAERSVARETEDTLVGSIT